MQYYQFMMLVGLCILYMLLNIYSFIAYLISIVKRRDLKELLNAPFIIMILLIPIIGSVVGLTIVDSENKWYLIVFYIGVYLILIGFIINLVVAFNV